MLSIMMLVPEMITKTLNKKNQKPNDLNAAYNSSHLPKNKKDIEVRELQRDKILKRKTKA